MYIVAMGLFTASLMLFALGLKPPRMTSSVLPNLPLIARLICVAVATILLIIIGNLPMLFDAIVKAVIARIQ